MSVRFLRATIFATLSSLAAVGVSLAADPGALVAKVPFDFVVEGTTFPAGTYRVESGPDALPPGVLAVQTAQTSLEGSMEFRKVYTLTVPSGEAEGKPRLIFQQVGDMNFLREVVPPSGRAVEVQ